MQVWERQKEQVPKKNAIEKCNSERNKNEKWRKCKKKITPETNWTNMISEKVAKSQEKAKKTASQTRDQLDKHDFGKKVAKTR